MSSPLIKVALIDLDEVDSYMKSCSYGFGIEISGGLSRYSFRSIKALSHSFVHLRCLSPFMAWKKGWHLIREFGMSRLSGPIIPVNLLISLKEVGDQMFLRASIFFGFASIPL